MIDRIDPIDRWAQPPAAVDAVRRVERTGGDSPDEQRQRRERGRAAKPAPQPGETADEHVDVRV